MFDPKNPFHSLFMWVMTFVVFATVVAGTWYGIVPEGAYGPAQGAAVANATASLRASYFNNLLLTGTPVLQRQESSIGLTGAPSAAVSKDQFSARWEGTLSVPANATYKFQIYTDDGMRVWIDGRSVLDKWYRQSSQYAFERFLEQGSHTLKVEYFQQWGGIKAIMSWTALPGGLAGPVPKQPTPTAAPRNVTAIDALWNKGACNHERYVYDANGKWTKKTLSDKIICHDIVYSPKTGLKLDLYLPASGGGKDMPLIVWVHGGAFMTGGRFECAYNAHKFVNKGFALACPSYRLSPRSNSPQVPDQVTQPRAYFPDPVRDVKTAIQFLRENAGTRFDPDAIILAGHSAGGYFAAFSALTNGDQKYAGYGDMGFSSDVQGAMIYAGVTDFDAFSGKGTYPGSVEALKMLLGTNYSRSYATANPTAYVRKGSVPFFIVHGTEDDLVPYATAAAFDKAFAAAGAEHKLYAVRGGTHESVLTDGGAFDSAVSWLTSKFK